MTGGPTTHLAAAGVIGRRRLLLLPMAAALASEAGCGASDPTYYTLAAWPGTPRRGGPPMVQVRSPTVASFLDRDFIVTATRDYALKLAGNRAWAEPIGDMIARVLATDLAQRLAGSQVFAQGSAAAGHPDADVSIDVTRFDKGDGNVLLRGTLLVRRVGGDRTMSSARSTLPFDVSAASPAADTASLVATMSRLLGELADMAADRLVALQAGSAVPLAAATASPG